MECLLSLYPVQEHDELLATLQTRDVVRRDQSVLDLPAANNAYADNFPHSHRNSAEFQDLFDLRVALCDDAADLVTKHLGSLTSTDGDGVNTVRERLERFGNNIIWRLRNSRRRLRLNGLARSRSENQHYTDKQRCTV